MENSSGPEGAERASMGNCSVEPSSTFSSLELSFRHSEAERDETTQFTFKERPLGLAFKKQAPVVIDRVTDQGLGDLWGVEEGMVLAAVQGRAVEGLSYEEIFRMLNHGLEGLPHRPPLLKAAGRVVGPKDEIDW